MGSRNSSNLSHSSVRGMSPMTPFHDAPDKFLWRWVNLDHPSLLSRSVSFEQQGNNKSSNVPLVHRYCRSGDIVMLEQLYSNGNRFDVS